MILNFFKNLLCSKKPQYARYYYFFDYKSSDREIEWVHKRIKDHYPQTRKTFIEIIKNAKNLQKNFYLKSEENGYYGENVAWWVYSGDIEININEYHPLGIGILCFPSEAQKEISLAEQRKNFSIFPDGYESYIKIISECESDNKPFVISAHWGKPNYFTVKKLGT